MATVSEPVEVTAPPAFRRDHLAHAWIGVKALSDAGDALWTIALAWTAVQVASPAVAGLIVAAGTVPRAVILLFGGVIADRADARRIMLAFNVLRVGVLVAVAVWVLTTPPSVAVLLLAAIAFGVCDAFYEPSAGTIARQLVRAADLPAYGAAAQTASRLGTMGGAAIGGFVVAHAGLAASASVNALTFTVVVAFIAIWLRPRFRLARAEKESALRGIARGFTHLSVNPTTRTLVIALSGLNLAVGPAIGLGLALRAHDEGWGAQAVGLFEALLGVGAALGSVSVAKWRPRHEARAGFRGAGSARGRHRGARVRSGLDRRCSRVRDRCDRGIRLGAAQRHLLSDRRHGLPRPDGRAHAPRRRLSDAARDGRLRRSRIGNDRRGAVRTLRGRDDGPDDPAVEEPDVPHPVLESPALRGRNKKASGEPEAFSVV